MSELLSAEAPEPADVPQRHGWEIWVRAAPPGEGPAAGVTMMTASEQMFFHGAPLAHVVAYERRLRTTRLMAPRRAAQLSRITIQLAD